jgi:lysyl-tRNA synthetase class 2
MQVMLQFVVMMDIETARARSRITARIRQFFDDSGYLEVETPILAPSLIPERSIEAFETTLMNPFSSAKRMFLTPSPELWMKRLIAHGWPNMYQLTKAFRNGESIGAHHNPEFTILEYYTIGATYEDSFRLTERFLEELGPEAVSASSSASDYSPLVPVERLTVAEAFRTFADIDLEEALSVEGMRRELGRRGMRFDDGDDIEALFNRLFVNLVEPEVAERPSVALFDYPDAIPTTARSKTGTPWAERWELYLRGVEVANCYTEEADPDAVDRYYAHEVAAKETSLQPHPPDLEYQRLFRKGFPLCSGVALGVDRLIQVLLGRDSIEGVILFPLSAMFW